MGIPQVITLVLYTMSMGMNVGKKFENGESALNPVLNYLVLMGLLWWGGFFT